MTALKDRYLCAHCGLMHFRSMAFMLPKACQDELFKFNLDKDGTMKE